MNAAFVAVSAIVPSLLLIWYFHQRDAFPEPQRVLWSTFGLGILITVPTAAVAMVLDQIAESFANPFAYGFTSAFLGAAIPEELFKFLVLWRYAARHVEFDEPMDGIVYGVAASLGFATLENVLYVAEGGAGVAFLRAVTAVPGHAFLGAIMGYFVGRARFDEARRGAFLGRAIVIPIVLHGLYDFPLLTGGRIEETAPAAPLAYLLLLAVPAILALEWAWAVRAVRRFRRLQVPPPQAIAAVDARARTAEPLAAAALTAGPGPPSPLPAVRSPGDRPPGKVGAWVMIVLGAVAASGGGLVILGVLAGFAFYGAEPEETLPLLVGTTILGAAPLGLGLALFVAGIRRLNLRCPKGKTTQHQPAWRNPDRPRRSP